MRIGRHISVDLRTRVRPIKKKTRQIFIGRLTTQGHVKESSLTCSLRNNTTVATLTLE